VFGPEASAVRNGKSMSVLISVESSILAFQLLLLAVTSPSGRLKRRRLLTLKLC